jgi:hypothetical protein
MKIILTENQFKRLIEGRGGHNKKGSFEDFLDAAKKIHSDENGNPKYDYSLVDYQGSTNKVKVICPKHKERQLKDTGNEYFEIAPDRHIRQGQGCRYCYTDKISKYTEDELEREAKKYQTAAEFRKNSYLHYNSAVKRPDLYKKITQHFVSEKESYGERLVSKILVDNGLIDSKCLESKRCPNREKTFEDCKNTIEGRYCRPLRFDFYIPELNTIVEYDGEQHFRPSTKFGLEKFETLQQNDKIKNEYCLKKGIKLIRIHYKFPSDIMEKSLMEALDNSQPITFLGNYPNIEK